MHGHVTQVISHKETLNNVDYDQVINTMMCLSIFISSLFAMTTNASLLFICLSACVYYFRQSKYLTSFLIVCCDHLKLIRVLLLEKWLVSYRFVNIIFKELSTGAGSVAFTNIMDFANHFVYCTLSTTNCGMNIYRCTCGSF